MMDFIKEFALVRIEYSEIQSKSLEDFELYYKGNKRAGL